ncbi:DUF5696 domain-containing protein [Fundicoccus sp. Sow4_H7]|uniref:DUF5696 domain-containing protein n=1 Tax=Fundicoccus sp. Sow4_H7 TaxID=3438784 RepID=UPI003F8F7AB5
MRKKHILLIILVIGVALATYGIFIATHYYLYDDYLAWIQPALTADAGSEFEMIPESNGNVPGMQLAAENDFFKLYTNTETTNVAIYEKESGMLVFTNPQNSTEDPIASGINTSELQSQFVLEYYDQNRNRIRVNNYDMSITSGQFQIENIEDGLRYTYTLADMSSVTGIVPTVISEELLESKVLAHLDEREARDVRSKYLNSTEVEGELILTENAIKSAIRLARLNESFEKAGFTAEDYLELMGEGDNSAPFSVTIAIEYQLTDTGLRVTVPKELIEESEGTSIANIEVLKFFGAQGVDAEGYMFVPNGSGSIIEMNNGKKNEAYRQYVYDMDAPAKSYVVTEEREIAQLPVFGFAYEDGAVFAIIEEGDAVSQINADVAEKRNSYNFIYPTYSLRGYELLSMFGSTGVTADLPVVEEDMSDISFSIHYNILPGENVDYSSMAVFYQNYLVDQGILSKKEEQTNLPFYLDIVGGIQRQKEILGVPYNGMKVMTSFEEANEIVQKLSIEGVSNIRTNYLGWFNGGYYHDIAEKIRDVNKLGSDDDLLKLKDQIESSGGKLYGNVAFQLIPQTSNNYSLNLESAKYYSGLAVVRGQVNPSTLRETSSLGYDESVYSYISPKFLNRYVTSFTQAIEDYDFSGISLRDLGNVLTSDRKRTESINRQAAKDIVMHAFDELNATEKALMVNAGNAYSLAYADDLIDIPMTGTDSYLIDYHVPFYQMVIHGYIPYAGEPINLGGEVDQQAILLDLIETGSAPRYIFSYEDSVEMKYTSLNYLYSTQFETWLSQATSIYNELNEVSQSVLNSHIVSHEVLSADVRKVTYANGDIFYINRSKREQEVESHTIPEMGYIKTKEENS